MEVAFYLAVFGSITWSFATLFAFFEWNIFTESERAALVGLLSGEEYPATDQG